jgi:hypothetical protein
MPTILYLHTLGTGTRNIKVTIKLTKTRKISQSIGKTGQS